jgi:hypothetical protein
MTIAQMGPNRGTIHRKKERSDSGIDIILR